MGHSTTGHKGHTSWEVVDFSIIQVYPCFAEFYLTDKASWIELSGKRTRGDVFWSESDVVSLHTYISYMRTYIHTYIPIAKQGCDCDGEDFFRPVIQISLLFGVQAEMQLDEYWSAVRTKRVSAWIALLRNSSHHEAMIWILLLHAYYTYHIS